MTTSAPVDAAAEKVRTRDAGPLPHVALAWLLCLSACAPSGPTAEEAAAAELAYREKVIASTMDMGLKGPPTARAAYAVLDGKASAQQVTDLGGEEEVRRLVRKFESRYENRVLRACLAKHFGSDEFTPAYIGAIAASPGLEALVADARRLAPVEYDAELLKAADPSNPSNEARARAAIAALLRHTPGPNEPSLETLTLLATSHMANATGGKCVASPKFIALLEQGT
jgi:hypothetical protein